MSVRWLHAWVDAALWLALAAAALTAASALALGVASSPHLPGLVGLAFCATLAVYLLDRLRDVERDRETSPVRARFVARRRRALVVAAALAAGAAAVLAAFAPARALVAPAAALPAALLHRRLKHLPLVKPLYVSAAWLAVVVGMPAALPSAEGAAWVAAVLGLAILANAIASNVRDREAGAARFGPARALRAAQLTAALATGAAVAAPGPVRPLGGVAALTLASLLAFRGGERYSAVVVDGALLVGALGAIAVSLGR